MLRFPLIITVLLLSNGILSVTNISAQKKMRDAEKKLFAEVQKDEKFSAECQAEAEKEALKRGVKLLPMIGHCFSGCPTSLPKPFYPETARLARVQGLVKVSTIVDESGKVIFARAISGNKLLRRSAVEAALRAKYTPISVCGKLIKFRWVISYHFVL